MSVMVWRVVTRYGRGGDGVVRADVHASMLRLMHDEWSQDEGTRGAGNAGGRTGRGCKRETELLCAEATRLLCVKGNVSVYSHVLQN